VVINCAAYTKVDLAEVERVQAFAGNATGVANLARACAERSIRMVHFSTDFVFDGTASKPYLPMDAVHPLSIYGQSKLRGEELIQSIDPAGWLIARTSWLFGATGPCFPRTILDRARNGMPLKIVNDQIGSPTYAPDLAAATLDLIEKNASGIHHITNTGQCSWYEFASALLQEFDIQTDLKQTTTAEFTAARPGQAKRPMFSVMTDEQLPKLLGRRMRAWHTTLVDYRMACGDRAPFGPSRVMSA
jgi:dTDP-4-dehydrorhamnose reductase